MKASIYTKYGSPDVLQLTEVKKPVPGDSEILVRVYAATVNRTDCAMLRAKPFIMRFFTGLIKPNKVILGTDFAGSIEATGKKVNSFQVGERVWGFNDKGVQSHAEYLTIPENNALIIIPGNISHEQAAASAEGAHYAYNFINKVTVKRGQKVLINGATGAIGSAALQLLKSLGADVTAVCNTKNIALIQSLGADAVIDYTKEDFTKSAKKFSFIFDTVGKSSFWKCKPLLEKKGVYMSSELGYMSQNPFLALITPIFGGKTVKFPIPLNPKRSLLFIRDLLENKKFRPVIDRSFPLTQIADAFRYVETGQKTGNVVIQIAKDNT